MRAAIYLRVSTDEQTTDNQERELRAAAERMGRERDRGRVPGCGHLGLQGSGSASRLR